MEYYIYDNWLHERVMIHLGKCRQCNYGEGKEPNSVNKCGHWLGPFKDIKEAELAAIKAKRKTISKCKFCM